MATETKTRRIMPTGFLLLIIYLFHSFKNSQVYASHTHMKTHHHQHLQANKSLHSPVSSSCESPSLPQGALKISHRSGPCSPVGQRQGNHNEDNSPSNTTAIAATSYALDSSGRGEVTVVPSMGRSMGRGNYLVAVGLGTPERELHLMVDTGSDISWVDCQPGQNDNRFDPRASSTFSREVQCDPPTCSFNEAYHDGSSSRGVYVRDKLTISSHEFPGFIFGCSLYKTGDFGQAAGILALGQSGTVTLISQTAATYSQIFCYCLPTRRASAGYLLFGDGAIEQCRRTNDNSFTALVSHPESPHHYFVNFNGVTIGGAAAPLPATSSTIMDSGTVFTHLPAAVFEQVRAEFVRSMERYYPVAPATEYLDTCFDMRRDYRDAMIPEVVLNLEGLDVSLGPSGVVWEESQAQVCLAFVAEKDEDGLTIIGNHQQRGLNVLYNVEDQRIEIGPGSCGS